MSFEKKKYTAVSKPIYGNWKVLSPNGILMFYGDNRRANWYLKRDLAILVDVNTIKLTFEPNGLGSAFDLYGSTPKENKCVVCGKDANLNRHHIVPICYRRHFPHEYKDRSSHDIVPLCIFDHEVYEFFADELKKQIFREFGVDNVVKISEENIIIRRIGSHLQTLIKHGDKLPIDKREKIENEIKEYFKVDELHNLEELFKKVDRPKGHPLNKRPSKYHVIISKIDIQSFVERWRRHFIDKMEPKYMPVGWEITRPAKKI